MLEVEVEQQRQFVAIHCAFLDNPPQFLVADYGSSHLADDVVLVVTRFSHETAITLITLCLLHYLQVKQITGMRHKQMRILLISLPDLCLIPLFLFANRLHFLKIALHYDVL